MIPRIKLRKKKYKVLQSLLNDIGLRMIFCESDVDWNYWMSPIMLPSEIDASIVCRELVKHGYEVIQPYLSETIKYKNTSNNTQKLPNIIISPSLDYMSFDQINKFVELVNQLVN